MGIAVADARSSPNSRNSNFDLSVRTLHGNETQSTYHERDQEKFFQTVFPFFLFHCLILSLLFLSSFYCSFLGCKNVFTARSLDWMASLRSLKPTVPPRQHVGNQIDAAMIFAPADFVKVHRGLEVTT
jgi:hypothetical protein